MMYSRNVEQGRLGRVAQQELLSRGVQKGGSEDEGQERNDGRWYGLQQDPRTD